MNNKFDAVVIGAGHAGCEAALALARLGHKTLLTTLNLDAVAFLACNPSIGGTAKGQLVCEIDALGGEMGVNTDKTLLQLRMLNLGKGPAVHSLRAQADKVAYHTEMKKTLENTPNLVLKQAEIVEICTNENKKIIGVKSAVGEFFECKAVVVCSGVYLKSRVIIGEFTQNVGPNGFAASNFLTQSLIDLGLEIRRFKTGTPARINKNSIDFSQLEVQNGDEGIQSFSFISKQQPKNTCVCYLTYTNEKTHEIIRKNLHRAPLYAGTIKGVGPRYCPSIEDKVVRFAEKERHQIFLEPEANSTNEVYIQGVSTSLPAEIQNEMYATIKGLENAEIMRNAYAIEYDCINSQQLDLSLEYKQVSGLFFAGQVNGTSGYEEAAAQGLIAGINAARKIDGKSPIILKRSDAYIGVLIDDLITKGTNEPYRMMTSRAEFRLVLRGDNADQRLTPLGYEIGLATKERFDIFNKKMKNIKKINDKLQNKLKLDEKLKKIFIDKNESLPEGGIKAIDALKRTNIDIFDIKNNYDFLNEFSPVELSIVNTEVKYSGYIGQQIDEIEKMKAKEETTLDQAFDYSKVKGLRIEAMQKLNKQKPQTLGQASRISGVSPADITVLSIYLKSHQK